MGTVAIDIGQFALLLAFALAVYAVVAAFLGGKLAHQRLVETAERAVIVTAGLVFLAVAALWSLLASDNFSVYYVASNSSRALPWFYKLSALWGGQEGSLLFWSWLLAIYALIAVLANRRRNRALMPFVVGVTALVLSFFLLVNNFVANPFDLAGLEQSAGAAIPYSFSDGQGLNPLLQYWAMVIHPPVLYLGYVGFTIPFAFAMAALMTRQLDDNWIRTIRRWMVVPWLFLGLGILLGAKWAYVVLGWGGYWGWDPVENASLIPWLAGTACLHSAIVQERKGLMKVSNMVLLLSTFLLCILGTYLTRSGVVSSVHGFAQSPVGAYFEGFLLFLFFFSMATLLPRIKDLRNGNQFGDFVSRENGFLYNNLLLVASAFAILWGTLYPLISGAITGEKQTLDPSFYIRTNGPIALLLLFLTGAGPMLAWKRNSWPGLKKSFLLPLTLSVVAGIALLLSGIHFSYSLACFALCVFAAAAILLELCRATRSQKNQNEKYSQALGRLIARAPRHYGAHLAHLGVVLLFLGIAGAGFNQETKQEMAIGDKASLGAYALTLDKIEERQTQNYELAAVILRVQQNGKELGILRPKRRYYPASDQLTTEVDLRAGLKEDVYAVLEGFNAEKEKASIHLFVNPLVTWVWIGGIVLMLGTLLTLLPPRLNG